MQYKTQCAIWSMDTNFAMMNRKSLSSLSFMQNAHRIRPLVSTSMRFNAVNSIANITHTHTETCGAFFTPTFHITVTVYILIKRLRLLYYVTLRAGSTALWTCDVVVVVQLSIVERPRVGEFLYSQIAYNEREEVVITANASKCSCAAN